MFRPSIKKRNYEESWLTKIPVLGYFFRRLKEDMIPIETTLKTGKVADGKTKKMSFLGGLITIGSRKSFDTLKLRRER